MKNIKIICIATIVGTIAVLLGKLLNLDSGLVAIGMISCYIVNDSLNN